MPEQGAEKRGFFSHSPLRQSFTLTEQQSPIILVLPGKTLYTLVKNKKYTGITSNS